VGATASAVVGAGVDAADSSVTASTGTGVSVGRAGGCVAWASLTGWGEDDCAFVSPQPASAVPKITVIKITEIARKSIILLLPYVLERSAINLKGAKLKSYFAPLH
jgi:hypothetical protein